MAITDTQKVDYLWKKIGFTATKTDTNALKKAPNEAIASPLSLRADKVMQRASLIPGSQPGSSSGVVTVYPTSSPVECTADVTSTANRTWKTGLTDWISPEFGSTYQAKVYIHTSSDAAGASGGDQVFATGSGNDDEWFFDYQSGVLHFIGTNLPNGISFTGKSVYIAASRYTGSFGVGGDIVEDTTPQLGGDLDLNSNDITGTGNISITGNITSTGTIDADIFTTDGISIVDNNISTTRTNDDLILAPAGTGLVTIDATTGLVVPSGTTLQRPSPASTGTIRYNTSSNKLEIYSGTWNAVGDNTVITFDEYSGDNSTTQFTLSATATTNNTWVTLNGVLQEPTNTYTVAGTTLTFNEAPLATDNIQVRNFFSGGSVAMDQIADADVDTKIQVEETADEDIIRFDVAGSEIMRLTGSALLPNIDSNGTTGYDLGGPSNRWRDLYISNASIHTASGRISTEGNVLSYNDDPVIMLKDLKDLVNDCDGWEDFKNKINKL